MGNAKIDPSMKQVNFRSKRELLVKFGIWCVEKETTRQKALNDYMEKCVERMV